MTAWTFCIAPISLCAVLAPTSAATTINFDDGTNLVSVGSFYSASEVVFSDFKWYQAARVGSSPPSMVGGDPPSGGYPVDVFPALANPLVATFTTPVANVNIIALDGGFDGAQIDALDQYGTVIA